ncbi:MAG: hypothetical protein L3J53_00720 [Proteobacteria bacterium]|nr:hypothetical protein [Pseudomonadota bacterium]
MEYSDWLRIIKLMTSDKTTTAFTPLRIGLMIIVVLSILGASIAFIFSTQSWAYLLGVFSTVFILMSVFLIFLELVWLNAMHKNIHDIIVKQTYKKAINIYLILLSIGTVVTFFILQLLLLR